VSSKRTINRSEWESRCLWLSVLPFRSANYLDAQLDQLVAQLAPELVSLPGIGTDHAATLLIVAGDNHPEALRSEASFASLCGGSPIEASTGKVVRHRLNLM
jgi:transposase